MWVAKKGFSYICYEEHDGVEKCVEANKDDATITKYRNKAGGEREYIKMTNNLYYKNVPKDMAEAEVRSLFEEFGDIKSFVSKVNNIGMMGYVCYEDKTGEDPYYGNRVAQTAIDVLHKQ